MSNLYSFEVLSPDGAYRSAAGGRVWKSESAATRALDKYLAVVESEGWATTGRVFLVERTGARATA